MDTNVDEPPAELVDAAADDSALAAPDQESAPPPAAADESRVPSIAAATKRIPDSTRGLLAELFKAEITSVRRISPDQLR